MRMWQSGVVVVVLTFGLGQPARAQNERTVQMDTLNVRDVLYHLGGNGGNGLALIDEINGGVVLVDTKPVGWGESILEVIGQVTDLPITTIINSHYHSGHVGSNGEFPDVELIIAHENTRAAMLRSGNYQEGSLGLPETVFQGRFSLLDDLDRIELYHFGTAHTDGDIVVVFPEKAVAYLGDLFPDKAVPSVDAEHGGSALAFPDTLAEIVAEINGVDRVITGHGPFPTTYAGRGRRDRGSARAWTGFMTWDDLAEYADFVQELVAEVRQAFSTSRTIDEAVEGVTVQERYPEYDMTGLNAMVEALYSELASR
ncbi:MAG: MBL fold metallo-hydrolase [Acidobacteriota bacterium]|nr:MBL fold metallo-hydrolase [Acidobacteriota bacterium]